MIRRAAGNAEPDFVGLGPACARPMQAVETDQAGCRGRRRRSRADAASPPRSRRRAGRCATAPGSTVGELPLAQITVEIADAHLVGRGPRTSPRAGDRHPAGPHLAKGDAGHVEHTVGRDIARGILDLVEKLLGAGGGIDAPACAGTLADGHVALGGHIGEGEAEALQSGHVLHAGVGEVAAAHLARAFQQMPGRRGLGETGAIVVVPAERVDDGADEERGVGDPARHHHRRPRLERGPPRRPRRDRRSPTPCGAGCSRAARRSPSTGGPAGRRRHPVHRRPAAPRSAGRQARGHPRSRMSCGPPPTGRRPPCC